MLRHVPRALIGLILLSTALGKSLDVPGFIRVVGTYDVLPQSLWRPAALAVMTAEGLLVLWLMVGRGLRFAALATAFLHLGYVGWTSLALLRGIEVPIGGSFGVFFPRPLAWSTVIENGAMVVLALLFWLIVRRPPDPLESSCPVHSDEAT
ncbi:MAG: MauE/DoxX family redox-associated membrane protein [bacterium]